MSVEEAAEFDKEPDLAVPQTQSDFPFMRWKQGQEPPPFVPANSAAISLLTGILAFLGAKAVILFASGEFALGLSVLEHHPGMALQ